MSPGAGTPHSDIYAYYIPPVACTPDSDIFLGVLPILIKLVLALPILGSLR